MFSNQVRHKYMFRSFFLEKKMWVLVITINSINRNRGLDKKESSVLIRGGFRKFCHRCYNFVNIHDRLLYYTLIERATFLLYNDTKTIHERNKYFEIHALKDTWGKTTGTFF